LISSIIGDPRFVEKVGNVFTEIGLSTLSPSVSRLLKAENLPEDSVERAILHIQRNCSFFPIWENFNFSFFIRQIYDLNQRLPKEQRISLFPSDMPFDWNTVDERGLKEFYDKLGSRDSVMASQIIERFDSLRAPSGKKAKALVIMNFRHAFGHGFQHPLGSKPNNVGRFLFDRYGTKVANVYVNFVAVTAARSDRDVSLSAIQDGKWDAAFSALNLRDVGFNFKNSPFGNDRFDIWPFNQGAFKYEQVFTGFVYYLPLSDHKYVVGVPGFVDSTFAVELTRRYKLFSTLPGRSMNYSTDLEVLQRDLNMTREHRMENLDSLSIQIQKWLK
jgi:hypothetical protein